MNLAVVIVTFNSNLDRLTEIIHLINDKALVIISDNSSNVNKSEDIKNLCSRMEAIFLSMGGNVGIAKAQNDAIKLAFTKNCSDILLLDDDSLPSHDMIQHLLTARGKILSEFNVLPVICATALDENKKPLAKFGVEISRGIYRYRDIISSGTLLNEEHIKIVGFHEEKLFIDCVDFEWGWRALNKNVLICIASEAKLNHRLGAGKLDYINARFGAPIRHYYQYRNILHMMRRNYVPLSWKLLQLFKLSTKLLLIILFFDYKKSRLKYAAWGIKDFLLGYFGPLKRFE